MNREYKSAVDWWLVSLWTILMLICLGGGVHLVKNNNDLLTGIGGIAVALGMLILSLPTRYTLTADKLLVRSGMFHWKIPLDSIVSAEFTSNPLSSPAWSLKRIRVNYRRKSGRRSFLLISPKDRSCFLRDLADSWPELDLVYDQRVERRARPVDAPGTDS